jgi:hypothetical protein
MAVKLTAIRAIKYTMAKCPWDSTAPMPKNVYGAVGPTKANPNRISAHSERTGLKSEDFVGEAIVHLS